MHICKEATMMEATCEGHWHLPNVRSIQAGQLQVCLSNVTPLPPQEAPIGINGSRCLVLSLKNSPLKVLGSK